MLNEEGEIEAADTVPKLVKALEQVKCGYDSDNPETNHRGKDLEMAALMLQVFDKLVMLYDETHLCDDPNICKVCVMVAAYGLQIEQPEENLIVSIH